MCSDIRVKENIHHPKNNFVIKNGCLMVFGKKTIDVDKIDYNVS